MLNQDGNPIIIKKGKKDHGHHGGAWKVAYADFVTAMMALFIVLWILGQDASVKAAVANYFKDPVGISDKGKNLLDGKAPSILELDLQNEMEQIERQKRELTKMGESMINELSDDPNFSNILDQIKIEIVEEGLRVEIIDSEDDIFFEIGTAELKPETRNLLKKIGEQLTRIPNKIVIEGHTDARPYLGSELGYTNFELSTDRANSARRGLLLGGLNSTQIYEVRGYADRRLRDSNDPYSVVNRRISIIVKYLSKN